MKTLTVTLVMVLSLFSSIALVAAPGGGGGNSPGGSYGPSAPSKTPEQRAVENYLRGVKNRDKGVAFELEASSETSEKKQEKLLKKAQKEYARAQSRFEKTIEKLPGAFEAYSDLGFVLRKQGHYDESLAAYNQALSLNPEYLPAIEYRGEAFLGLNRLDDAKQAYMVLFRQDRTLADTLMTAMQSWVNKGVANGELSEEARQAFSQWVAERSQLSEQTSDLSPSGRLPWQTVSR